MLSQDLERIGFNEKEANLYLAALELGESNIQQLAKKSGVKRTTAYDIIESLKKKGFMIQLVRSKRMLFSATDPRKLENDIEEQRHVVKRAMPELLAIANALDSKPKVSFFEGHDGIREVYKDTLNYPDQELLAWVAEEAMTHFDVDWLDDVYLPKRIEKKIWVRAIAPDAEIIKQYKEVDEKSLRKTRLTDLNSFGLDVEINLYGKNRVALMSFEENFGMVIESRKIFETLKNIFEMNWKALAGRNKK
ncbi:MAG: Transcriptional regulator, TrmB [Parcubacteria group bacterium GW2011_GWD2_38_11]|nr:MAG: Transcriptional regulator, TrmB [Parcubacteria group bacterium GW2011_GWD2_38_11]